MTQTTQAQTTWSDSLYGSLDEMAKSRNGAAVSETVWYEYDNGRWWVHDGREMAYVNSGAAARRIAAELAAGGEMVTSDGMYGYRFCNSTKPGVAQRTTVGRVGRPTTNTPGSKDMKPQGSINKKDVEFNTTEYECAHGKMPAGRGGWYFFSDKYAGFDAPHYFGSGLYSEVRSKARTWAAANGFGTMYVGS